MYCRPLYVCVSDYTTYLIEELNADGVKGLAVELVVDKSVHERRLAYATVPEDHHLDHSVSTS